MKKILIQPKVLGMASTNCYVVKNQETNEILIVDPAGEADKIIDTINRMEGVSVGILFTHGHFDHIEAAKTISEKYNIMVYAHEKEKELIERADLNLSQTFMEPFVGKADIFVKDKEILDLGGFSIEVIHTPGHTCGSCCYYFKEEKIMFTGDTLFMESVGRTDFPTSNPREMKQSLDRLLQEFPEDVLVYPGHMEMTSIEHEKRFNPYG